MPRAPLPLATIQQHRNQQLFSDYYLNVVLPQRAEWSALAPLAQPLMQQLGSIVDRYIPSRSEPETEQRLVRPILRALGHDLADAPASLGPEPGILLHAGDQAPDEPLVYGQATAWDRALDVSLSGASRSLASSPPAYQCILSMQGCGAEWGMLTNGRLWRLYHKDSAQRQDRYYEVDLPALLATGNPQAWLYFYGFFHRSAFEPGPLSLSTHLQASLTHLQWVAEQLKLQVYAALRYLAQGFLDYPLNRLERDRATLNTVFEHSLIVLYRLLFIFYAEARELLPLRQSALYRDHHSLYALSQDVERSLSQGMPVGPMSAAFWPRLLELFHIVGQGSLPLRVPAFDDGLFDPRRYPFLERHSVGDSYLQQAITRLVRVDPHVVDYRDLAERYLGTLYEELLEFHLEETSEEPGWTVALVNEQGQREPSGSFHTPDRVVTYMVDQTLGPVLRELVEQAPDVESQVEAVLGVNVLDPAMGSGHFLVEATEYMARFLVGLQAQPGPDAAGEPDLAYWKRRVATSCIYGLDFNPLAVELAKLSLWLITVSRERPLSFLDHHLRCGNALVGSSLVELLSERRRDAGAGRRARRRSLAAPLAQQLTLFDAGFRQRMSSAIGSIGLIERSSARTLDDVREQGRLYLALREMLNSRYAALANLCTAARCGLAIDPRLWQPLLDYVVGKQLAAAPQFEAWRAQAEVLARQYRFFHWELEFPEVFFNAQGESRGEQAGFDVVVGNPPHVRREQLMAPGAYLAASYIEPAAGVADVYVYFYQQGIRLLRHGGRLAYTVSNRWLSAEDSAQLRSYLADRARQGQILDFGYAPVLEPLDDAPGVTLLEKQPQIEPGDQPASRASAPAPPPSS